MDEPIREPSGGPWPRRPYWVVGLALLGLVMVMLAIAFVADRQLRPRLSVDPAPTPSLAAAATSPAAAGTSNPANGSSSPLSLEQEIEEAYLRYWDVYSEALLNLDTSRIPEVAADDELRRIEEEVGGLRNRNEAARINVTHDYEILDITSTGGTVYDEALNQSYTVDPVTKTSPEGTNRSEILRDLYFFEKRDHMWKIVKSYRVED
ncbi:MAG: hypothetical protein GEU73_17330 [Chloroflexi bacterium]|nr:hypothetical protein [Chloroflexota bacterium]